MNSFSELFLFCSILAWIILELHKLSKIDKADGILYVNISIGLAIILISAYSFYIIKPKYD